MLSVLKNVGRSPLIPSCRRSIVSNRIWQPSISHRAQSTCSGVTLLLTRRALPLRHKGLPRQRSLCTWTNSSGEIKSLKRQRLFFFGVALAAPVVISLYYASKVLIPFRAAAISATSWNDKKVTIFTSEMYDVITSKPEIMSKIGSEMKIERPFVWYRSRKSAIVRAGLYSKGAFVGDVRVEMPIDEADVKSATSWETSALQNNEDSFVDCDIEVSLDGADTFKFRAALSKRKGNNRMEENIDDANTGEIVQKEVGSEFELDLEQVEEAASTDSDDKTSDR